MIVLDASAAVTLLADPPTTAGIQARLVGERHAHVPHVFDVEVAHALRGLVLGRRLSAPDAYRALRRLAVMPLVRWPHARLLTRALALRDRLSAYDATYVALPRGSGRPCSPATAAWPGSAATGPGSSWSSETYPAKPLPRAAVRRSRALSSTSGATPWSRATSRSERPVAAASSEMAAASS